MATTLYSNTITVNHHSGEGWSEGPGYYFTGEIIENSVDDANNSSNITINHYGQGFNGWCYQYYSNPSSEIKLDNSRIAYSQGQGTGPYTIYPADTKVLLSTWTGDIAHNADGTKSITVNFIYSNTNTTYYMPYSNTITATNIALTPTVVNPPIVSTLSSSNITSNSVDLSFTASGTGTITSNIEVSTVSNFSTIVTTLSSNSGTISTLNRATTYYARGNATNAAGTSTTTTITFSTLAEAPVVTSPVASSITDTRASVSATVSNNGGKAIISQRIDLYDSTKTTLLDTINSNVGTFTGLTTQTTYYMNFTAANADASTTSAWSSFTTTAPIQSQVGVSINGQPFVQKRVYISVNGQPFTTPSQIKVI